MTASSEESRGRFSIAVSYIYNEIYPVDKSRGRRQNESEFRSY